MIPVIWVEGVIASGKTRFAKEIAKRLEFKLLEEPVEANFYLDAFYNDPERYAFGMQIFLLHHRYTMKIIASMEAARGVHPGLILDRSIAGDRAFAKLHWRKGNISDLDWQCYNYCYQVMARSISPPTLLLYLDVQPETAYKRMQDRHRGVEDGVPLQYLRELRSVYDELLVEIEAGLVPWHHSVKVSRIIWDTEIITPEAWDAVAATIRDQCGKGECTNIERKR